MRSIVIRRLIGSVAIAFVLLTALAHPVGAQPALPRPNGFEVMAGVDWDLPAELGTADANLTAPPGQLTLFRAASRVQPATGLDLRIGYSLSRLLGVEGAFGYVRPELRVVASNDIEGTPTATIASEAYRLYRFDANALLSLAGLLPASPVVPYVLFGAGHMRQLDSESVLLDTGTTFQVGGGAKYFFVTRAAGLLRGGGIRGEVQWRRIPDTLDLRNESRMRIVGTVGAIVAF
jgi:opacity protein-like surface antigen